MSLISLARPEIQALQPYHAAAQVDGMTRLNANELPWSNEGDAHHRPLNRYPEVRPQRLAKLLAARYGCSTENLLVTRGTSEGIDLLLRVFCRPGIDQVLVSTPTFSMYEHYARIQGAAIVAVPSSREQGFRIDVNAMLGQCVDTTRVIFVCSPNNPTGNLFGLDDLVRLLEARANRSLIVVDEAYIEFSGSQSAVSLLHRYENLLVLRTLSKALACAGARCGSVIAATPCIQMLAAVQAPYAMSTPVVEYLEARLEGADQQRMQRLTHQIIESREQLQLAIADFPFVQKVWPSAANFFLVQVDDAQQLLAHCTQQGILLRHFGGELADCVRITVGSAEDNSRLVAAFGEFRDA